MIFAKIYQKKTTELTQSFYYNLILDYSSRNQLFPQESISLPELQVFFHKVDTDFLGMTCHEE